MQPYALLSLGLATFIPSQINAEIFSTTSSKTFNSPSLDTSFGYSLAITNDKQIIVGEPRANHFDNQNSKGLAWAGAVHKCEYDQSNLSCPSEIKPNLRSDNSVSRSKMVFYGMHVNYNAKNINNPLSEDLLLTCAPGSYSQSTDRNLHGMCMASGKSSNDQIKFIKGETSKKATNFGYETSFIDDIDYSKVFISAPLANDEMGSLYYSKNSLQTRNSILTNLKGIEKEQHKIRNGISVTNFKCNKKIFVSLGNTDAAGLVKIHQLDANTKQSLRKDDLRSEKQEFGSGFGFAQTVMNINNEPYLLISSPFGQYGKLELFSACDQKPANDKLPQDNSLNNIPRLGFSLANVGNIDNIEGDEILVGAPQEEDGKILVLSVRGDKLQLVQILNSNEDLPQPIPYLGLAVSKNSVNIDNQAGTDIAVSGKDSIAVFLSKPTFSLSDDAQIDYTIDGSKKTSIKIDQILASNSQEKVQACVRVNTNVNQDLKLKATITLDANRLGENKRLIFSDDKYIKEVDFRRQASSGRYCSNPIAIKRKDEAMRCPNNRFLSLSAPINMTVTNVVSGLQLNNDVPVYFWGSQLLFYVESSIYKQESLLKPDFDCIGPNQCVNNLFLKLDESAENSVKKVQTININKRALEKSLSFTLENKEKSRKIRNVYLQLSSDSNAISIKTEGNNANTQCKSAGEDNDGLKIWECHFEDVSCQLAASTVIDGISLKVDTLASNTKNIKINYQLIKDGEPISSNVNTFAAGQILFNANLGLDDSAEIILSKATRKITYDPKDDKQDRYETIQETFSVRNTNEVLTFVDYQTLIKVPTHFWNAEFAKWVPIWLGDEYELKNNDNSKTFHKVGVEQQKSSNSNKPNAVQPIDHIGPDQNNIKYDVYNIKKVGDAQIIAKQSVIYTIRGDLDREQFKNQEFGNKVYLEIKVEFNVNQIDGIKYLDDFSTKQKSLSETAVLKLREYDLNKVLDESKFLIIGLAVGLGILILLVAIAHFTGLFKKEVVFKTDKNAPQAEEDEEAETFDTSKF